MKTRDAFEALISAYESLAISYGSRSGEHSELQRRFDELQAEYDQHAKAANELDLQRLGEMARIAKERDELRAKLNAMTAEDSEQSGDSGMLPRWWNVGDEIVRAEDGRRAKIIKVSHRIETEVDGKPGCAGEQWVAEKHGGWKLHCKAEDIQAEPEPWRSWKVGTPVAHMDGSSKGFAIRASDNEAFKAKWYRLGYREQPSVGADGEGQS